MPTIQPSSSGCGIVPRESDVVLAGLDLERPVLKCSRLAPSGTVFEMICVAGVTLGAVVDAGLRRGFGDDACRFRRRNRRRR